MGFTWIDILAVLPFYFEIFGMLPDGSGGNFVFVRIIRLVRLVRVMRMLKAGRNSASIQLLMVAMGRCKMAIVWMGILLLMATILFAAMMYFAELDDTYLGLDNVTGEEHLYRLNTSILRDSGKKVPFQDIVVSMWWAVGTLTTGGYGDLIPYTQLGRVVATLCMMCNLILNSYPITIICITFGDCWAQYQKDQFRKKRRKRLLHSARSGDEDTIKEGNLRADKMRRNAQVQRARTRSAQMFEDATEEGEVGWFGGLGGTASKKEEGADTGEAGDSEQWFAAGQKAPAAAGFFGEAPVEKAVPKGPKPKDPIRLTPEWFDAERPVSKVDTKMKKGGRTQKPAQTPQWFPQQERSSREEKECQEEPQVKTGADESQAQNNFREGMLSDSTQPQSATAATLHPAPHVSVSE